MHTDSNPNHSSSPGKRRVRALMKKAGIFLILFLSVSAFVILGVANDIRRFAEEPAGAGVSTFFKVSSGMNLADVSGALKEKDLISDAFKFRIVARYLKLDKKIQAGQYRLTPSMTPLAILDTLVTGKVYLKRITIPEGLTLKQIAALYEDAGMVKADEFIRAAEDRSEAKRLGIEADTFEGYLFPETYFFPEGVTAKRIVATMAQRFKRVFSEKWEKRAQELGFTVHDVVTLASIIEKETGDPSERPIISSVFHNRLHKKMRLQSDPTVIYGIDDFDGNLTRAHLKEETPYNTYTIYGLPPGPIASPGKGSLEAALYPADTDYFFFVSRNGRNHQFSRTFREHKKAVRKYQSRR